MDNLLRKEGKRPRLTALSERTFIMLKPDAVANNRIGVIISRIESEGFKIKGLKLVWAHRSHAEKLYEVHSGKSFYEELVDHTISGPIVPMVVQGPDAISRMRKLIGNTNPALAEQGTIRRDFGMSVMENVIHASDNPQSADRELRVFFSESELQNY